METIYTIKESLIYSTLYVQTVPKNGIKKKVPENSGFFSNVPEPSMINYF